MVAGGRDAGRRRHFQVLSSQHEINCQMVFIMCKSVVSSCRVYTSQNLIFIVIVLDYSFSFYSHFPQVSGLAWMCESVIRVTHLICASFLILTIQFPVNSDY